MSEPATSRTTLQVAATALLVVVLRLVIHYLLGGTRIGTPGQWLAMILAGLLLALAISYNLLRIGQPEAQQGSAPQWAWWTWLVLLLLAVLGLPYAFGPRVVSIARWLLGGTLLALPAAWYDTRPRTVRPRVAGNLLIYALLLWSLLCAVVYLASTRHQIGSVDFFYYVCTARDMLAPDVTVSDHSYIYFPGVYTFWRSVMRGIGTTLADLQLGYLLLLVANAVLVGATISRVTRRLQLGLFGAVWYLVLASRFEGLAGVNEPLATAMLLGGLCLWAGQPLVGLRGLAATCLLGVALGLTVYAKQQAGLLTLGAVALLVLRPATRAPHRHSWAQLSALPLIAITVLLAGILLEGRGWIPLRKALEFAAGYGTESSLPWNLYVQIRADELAACAAGLMAVAWCLIVWKGDRRQWAETPAFQVASWALFGFLFALVQFVSRPFGHYMLLGIPCLVVASVLLGHLLWAGFTTRDGRSAAQSVLVATIALIFTALPLASLSSRTDTLDVWRWPGYLGPRTSALWHERPAIEHDLQQLRGVVAPGSTMYILPPRHNSIYFFLGTTTASPDGYTFFETDLRRFPWQDCRYFVLLTGELAEFDYQFSSREHMEAVRLELLDNEYTRRGDVVLKAMELYERTSSGK